MQEWTTLVKTAFAAMLLILAAGVIIFLAFLGLNAANRGGDQLTGHVSTLDRRAFESYNNTTVSGMSVLSAIGNYRDHPIAVIVRTNAGGRTNYCALLWNVGLDPHPGHGWGGVAATDTLLDWEDALGYAAPAIVTMRVHRNIQYNNTREATDHSSIRYINPNGQFNATLIIDTNDTIVGILFEQAQIADPLIGNVVGGP